MKTLNKAVARYNGISLIIRILIGLFICAVLALVAPGAGWVGELGSLLWHRALPSWTAASARSSGCTCSPPFWLRPSQW